MTRSNAFLLAVAAVLLAQLPLALSDLVRPALRRPLAGRIDAITASEDERIAAGFQTLPDDETSELRAFGAAVEAVRTSVPPDAVLHLLIPDDPVFGLVADRLGALLYPRTVRFVKLPLGAPPPRPASGPGLFALRIGESCAAALPAEATVYVDAELFTLFRTAEAAH